jgi:hypothetical protein
VLFLLIVYTSEETLVREYRNRLKVKSIAEAFKGYENGKKVYSFKYP